MNKMDLFIEKFIDEYLKNDEDFILSLESFDIGKNRFEINKTFTASKIAKEKMMENYHKISNSCYKIKGSLSTGSNKTKEKLLFLFGKLYKKYSKCYSKLKTEIDKEDENNINKESYIKQVIRYRKIYDNDVKKFLSEIDKLKRSIKSLDLNSYELSNIQSALRQIDNINFNNLNWR